MSRDKRISLIRQIEAARSSRVICYVTGDRAPFTAHIAEDAVRILRKHCETFRTIGKIDMFLYSRGGDMVAPLRIVRMIREHCRVFGVLVPYRAHSAATSIALGADEIVMGKAGELSPVDPTTGHPFNPQDPNNPKQRIPISVEDVTSYFLLAKEQAGLRDDQMVTVLNELANKVNPLALGNVYRAYRMARLLTEKLLSLHMDARRERKKIQAIVEHLTEKLCIHAYPITRAEAQAEIGLKVIKPDAGLENTMWSLYESYEEEMKLTEPFEPARLLADEKVKTVEVPAAFIESRDASDMFLFTADIRSVEQTPGQVAVNLNAIGWRSLGRKGDG